MMSESEDSHEDQSVSESDSDEDTRRRKRRAECKEMKRRKVADRANALGPLSGLKLALNIHDEDRLAATTLLKWYTKYGTLCNWVEQFGTFETSKMLTNKHEARSWAWMMDLLINEKGWKVVVTCKAMKDLARRLLALELTSEPNNNWDLASRLGENRKGIMSQKRHKLGAR